MKYLLSFLFMIVFFSPAYANEWKDAGFSVQEAHSWQSAGIDSPQLASEWKSKGIDHYRARHWHREGFSPEDAHRWVSEPGSNIDPFEANLWVKEGFLPKEAIKWKKLDIYPAQALLLLDEGYSVEEAQWLSSSKISEIQKNKSDGDFRFNVFLLIAFVLWLLFCVYKVLVSKDKSKIVIFYDYTDVAVCLGQFAIPLIISYCMTAFDAEVTFIRTVAQIALLAIFIVSVVKAYMINSRSLYFMLVSLTLRLVLPVLVVFVSKMKAEKIKGESKEDYRARYWEVKFIQIVLLAVLAYLINESTKYKRFSHILLFFNLHRLDNKNTSVKNVGLALKEPSSIVDKKYKAVFYGKKKQGVSVAEVKSNLSIALKNNPKIINTLLSGKHVTLKNNADLDTCKRIKGKLERCGLIISIEEIV